MKEPLSSKLLKIALYVVMVLGIAGVLTLPLFLETFTRYFYGVVRLASSYRTFILLFLTMTAVLGLWIIGEMIMMLRTIGEGPFVKKNVAALNRVGMILFVLAVLFIGKCLLYVTLLTMGGACLFIIAGLFAFTLANLFQQAINFKEENDLTI